MNPAVTVAIPVRDGGQVLAATLEALARQTVEHELLVCDSQSSDSSVVTARAYGARVIEIARARFTHGGARNLLMREASGANVALLTQDSEPADERWLARLLDGLELGEDVAIVYGPYRPRPDAPVAVRLELERWFSSLSPHGTQQVERLPAHERSLAAAAFVGARGFFTDANACISRAAWERVPFREIPYAEDRALALDMLRAGYAKAYVPDAAVWHSHSYTGIDQLRRCFDEWRGLREVYGWRQPANPWRLAGELRGALSHARRELSQTDTSPSERRAALAAVSFHHLARLVGAVLGSRADVLPARVREGLSLERRASFVPLELSSAPSPVVPHP
jgi:rhamnosyltransferase